jgi:uncharacterized protein YndB with AHSA1/START domain
MSSTLTIRHWIATTPERVWRAYTTPEMFHQFFAPDGLHIPLESVVMELWVGGRFEFDMVFDDSGDVSPNRGFVVALHSPNQMVFREPDFMGAEIQSTQTFVKDGSGTLIEIVQAGMPDEVIDNPEVIEAFRSCFRKLGRLLDVETEDRD